MRLQLALGAAMEIKFQISSRAVKEIGKENGQIR